MKTIRIGILGVVLIMEATASAQTNVAAFFRISSPSNAVITDLDPIVGTITWSNDVAGVTNQLQRAYVLNGTSNWVDFVQLVSTSGVTSTERIIDLDPPENMVFIPGSVFEMGDYADEGDPDELPVHAVYTSPFYVGKHEVTNDEILDVMQWAYDHGKLSVSSASVQNAQGSQQVLLDLDAADCRITWNESLFDIKANKGQGYPCVEVSWFGAVAYCNYRSEKEGRSPCYNLNDWSCNWDANGYRLLTEAEWEKAARGGLTGWLFGWGDFITHNNANYYSLSNHVFDVSTTRGYHPDYDDGGFPYTSPVGSFAPNAYGLHDVAGNVWEWCWDWAGDYASTTPAINPKGASSGASRVFRGGSWGDDEIWFHSSSTCRSANRHYVAPWGTTGSVGFRVCLSVD